MSTPNAYFFKVVASFLQCSLFASPIIKKNLALRKRFG
ncbi:hypothetical protein FD23_GL001017 [Lactobacillus delbrueckii subsp. delbrueckii DSM 20074 = JCM 1012]|nr:hypothetical protein G134_1750 [Lactobacillus delbrueckii subsp. lactis CRL581]KRK23284.1 hypothetical protein FD23_GL001017 [Lactobacillus delbrueckii subsp. delbrueckii DSM 20074 = JCM 1012]